MANYRPSDVTLETEELERYMVQWRARRIRESDARIIWNVGVGDGSGLSGLMLRMSEKAVRTLTDFDHVIRISMSSISEGCNSPDEIRYKAVMAKADELNIMDEDNTLRKLKNELEDETYFTYKVNEKKESELVQQTMNKISEKLTSKRCLIIVENILHSFLHPTNKWLLNSGLPLPLCHGKTYWVISTPSVDVYRMSMSETSNFFNHYIFHLVGWLFPARLFVIELFHVAKSIQSTIFSRELTRVMDVLWSCLLYVHLYSHNHENKTKEAGDDCRNCVQLNELVNMWICEGIFSKMPNDENQQELVSEYSSNSFSDGDKICRALISHSLLHKHNSSNSHLSPLSNPFPGMGELLADLSNHKKRFDPNEWSLEVWKFLENISKEWVNTNWISFCDLCFKPSLAMSSTTTTLIFRGCTILSTFLLESWLPSLKNLFVLDLSNTSIEQLPVSLCEMKNLRFLSLKGCNRLRSLTADTSSMLSSSPLGPLENLEFLDLGGVSVDIPDDVGKSKSKLRFLDLSNPSIISLSSVFFRDISNLRELFFLGCTSLKNLPPSLINLCSLETFSLSESRLISLPIETFEQIPKLQVLNLINNQRLQWLPKLAGHTGLKSITLSGLPCITHLSLDACRSLEIVYLHDLDQLEELELSATSIKEFPEWISNLRGLKRLNLLALPQLKRIPWHKLEQIPEVLNMDQLKYVGAKIFLTDSRLFSSFTLENYLHFRKKGGPLQSCFISLCNKRSKKDDDIDSVDQIKNMKSSYYRDIPLLESTFKQQFQQRAPLNQHIEIHSAEQYPTGLGDILDFKESLSLWDDNIISSLTDLNTSYQNLQECKLGRCHLMDSIFSDTGKIQGRKLQTLWAFYLKKMTKMLQHKDSHWIGESYYWSREEFLSLKHVHLENCPKLESIFPYNITLNCLETLTVLYCGNLRTVFYKYEDIYKRDKPTANEVRFARLHTIQLYELQKLSYLFDESPPLDMKEWKELHFRGCWSFEQLPLLVGSRNQKVIVDGEERQCKKLKAGMAENQICCYDFKLPGPLASIRERVKNNIFLK